MDMTISQLARAGGVGVETVRYYQRRGLLPEPPPRAASIATRGVRHYGDVALRRLRFIRSAQAAGFTLHAIGELLELDSRDDRARVRALARERIARLDGEIARLQAARNALTRLERECAAGGPGPCPILETFDHAPAPSHSPG